MAHKDIYALRDFQDSTVFAVRAPFGTVLEVLDPSEAARGEPNQGARRHFRVNLKSQSGPIDVYLLQSVQGGAAAAAASPARTAGGEMIDTATSPEKAKLAAAQHFNPSPMAFGLSPPFCRIRPAHMDTELWFDPVPSALTSYQLFSDPLDSVAGLGL